MLLTDIIKPETIILGKFYFKWSDPVGPINSADGPCRLTEKKELKFTVINSIIVIY